MNLHKDSQIDNRIIYPMAFWVHESMVVSMHVHCEITPETADTNQSVIAWILNVHAWIQKGLSWVP